MFRQYIQGKRHKYGVKLYVLAEPTGMVQKILVYGGSSDPDVGGKKHTEKVVHSLMEDKKSAGHSLCMDNFYNSVGLSEQFVIAYSSIDLKQYTCCHGISCY
nr:unnamed protein product [Callosobruchus chinensis]